MGSGPEFFQTIMGRAFFEGTMPALVRELKSLNKNLAKAAEDKEDEHTKAAANMPPKLLVDLALVRARENTASGDMQRVLVGDCVIDMLQEFDPKEDPKKVIDALINGLLAIEDAAFILRKELAGDPD